MTERAIYGYSWFQAIILKQHEQWLGNWPLPCHYSQYKTIARRVPVGHQQVMAWHSTSMMNMSIHHTRASTHYINGLLMRESTGDHVELVMYNMTFRLYGHSSHRGCWCPVMRGTKKSTVKLSTELHMVGDTLVIEEGLAWWVMVWHLASSILLLVMYLRCAHPDRVTESHI